MFGITDGVLRVVQSRLPLQAKISEGHGDNRS